MKIRKGYVINGYELEELISSGGFARVYRAKRTFFSNYPFYGEIIAIKVLHPRRLNKKGIALFKNEAKIARSLNHQNVIKFFDFVIKDDNYFIFEEWVNGKDLEKIIILEKSENFRNFNVLLDIAKKVARGLSYLHQNNIVHKDVNPSNILVSFDLKKVKVTDFSISKKKSKGLFGFLKRDIKDLFVGGTREYMAPEQLIYGISDKRSDIYSFGKTLEKLFSSFDCLTFKLKKIIKIATAENPNDRFENIEEILSLLENLKI